MTNQETMKLSLEALKIVWEEEEEISAKAHQVVFKAIKALEEALANHIRDDKKMVSGVKDSLTTQQEQDEPVAWRDRTSGTLLHEEWLDADPLYTTPQQREWLGLTDEEIKAVNAQVSQIPPIDYTTTTYAKAIEAKLKEKNND